MDIKEILSKVGMVATAVNPAAGAVIGIVNSFLPEDKKLLPTAKPEEIEEAMQTLTPEQRDVAVKKIEAEISRITEEGQTNRAEVNAGVQALEIMSKVGSQWSWVRPFCIVTLTIASVVIGLGVVVLLGIAIWNKDKDSISALAGNWALFFSVLYLFMEVVKSYFGLRTIERQSALQASTPADINIPITGNIGLLASIAQKIFK